MPESTPQVIPEEVMLARLEQSEQMREFFVQMWLQNPALAAQAGPRVRELMTAVPAADQAPT
jgi:hypothetical protein